MLTINSTSMQEGRSIPNSFVFNGPGCSGENLSPELEWQGAPAGTKSFALTMYDPDASTGHGWWHWTVINIPENVNRLDEGASNQGALPPGAQELTTDFKQRGYGGPCPPKGSAPHRYIFTIYALKKAKLEVDLNKTAESIKSILKQNTLAEANFTVKYGR